MSQAAANSSGPQAKAVPVALVGGRQTLEDFGTVLRHLVVGLLDVPMPVSLICPAGSDLQKLPVPPLQVMEYAATRTPLLRGRAVEVLLRQLDSAGVALLHALDGSALALTRQLAAKADLAYVAGACSLRHGVRAADHRCRALLAASAPIERMLVESHAAPAEMIHLLRPGVHQARSATCFINPNHATAIVASGRLVSPDPFTGVLEGFAQLRQAGQECVFFLIGSGRAEPRLRRLAEKLELMEDLTFVDRQEPAQLAGILRAADIFISPVQTERLDVELLTAMAAGVPVLTAEAPAADFVMADRTALVFQAGDAAELTVKLFSLLEDRAAARSLAEAALAHLREHHSPARMVAQLVQVYHDAVRSPVGAD